MVSCKLTYNSDSLANDDYANTWTLVIEEENNYYSVLDSHAGLKWDTSTGKLKFLGKIADSYYLVLPNSGYLYIYSPKLVRDEDESNKELNELIFGKGNHLRIVDPRGKGKIFYFGLSHTCHTLFSTIIVINKMLG